MTLVKFSNGNKSQSLSPIFNDVFESFFNTDSFVSDRLISRVPAVNIAETENEYHIELAVPGMKKEDFKVSLDKNVLSISAETKFESEENREDKRYNRREYSYNSFVRTFTLPESADHSNISAEYTHGILKVAVAKKEEAKIQSREISIR
ncbi:Hsp20/alpha crystallin family protein [Flavihumibacter sp. R14]|nr:Hsp20/alpha crystallin family protein [Flavihumibacter soli]